MTTSLNNTANTYNAGVTKPNDAAQAFEEALEVSPLKISDNSPSPATVNNRMNLGIHH